MAGRKDHDAHVQRYWAFTCPNHDAHARARRRYLAAERIEREQERIDLAKAGDRRFVQSRMVQDPYMTDAEYHHQRSIKSGPHVGKIAAQTSMIEYIGGLARMTGFSDLQIEAAAKYRMAFDGAQIGGARAVDYAAVKVDTSGPSSDGLYGRTVDHLDRYKGAVRHIGMAASSLVERVVCHDMPLTTRGMKSWERQKAKEALAAALDDLAVHFKLVTKKAA